MIKKLITFSSIVASPYLCAIEYGIGSSFKNEALYFPINISSEYRVEPSISFQKIDMGFDESDDIKNTSITLSNGLFKLQPVTAHVKSYVGARAGFSYADRTSNSSNGHYRALSLAPSIGFEYFPTENVSINVETGFSISRRRQSYNGNGAILTNDNSIFKTQEITEITNFTDIGIRMYF